MNCELWFFVMVLKSPEKAARFYNTAIARLLELIIATVLSLAAEIICD